MTYYIYNNEGGMNGHCFYAVNHKIGECPHLFMKIIVIAVERWTKVHSNMWTTYNTPSGGSRENN